jgi:hypothetical protein
VNADLDEPYLIWLHDRIAYPDRHETYMSFAKQLYIKEFVWLVPNDDNRAADGKDLREEFCREHNIESPDPEWMGLGCSMLELLIAMSRMFAFEAEGEPRDWFWKMMDNIDILLFAANDRKYSPRFQLWVDFALDRVIWRTYSPTGEGGLFPLETTDHDQRDVELWYQMSAYIVATF